MSEAREYRYLGLHPFTPADVASRQQYDLLIALADRFQIRQTISTQDARHTYAVLLDKAGRWGLEDGTPIIGVHLQRNLGARMAHIARAELPTLAAAQDWFTQQGLDAHRILSDSYGNRPADGITEAIDTERGRPHLQYRLTDDTLTSPDSGDRYFLFEPSGSATTDVHWLIHHTELDDGIFRLRETFLPSALATHHWLTDHSITRTPPLRARAHPPPTCTPAPAPAAGSVRGR